MIDYIYGEEKPAMVTYIHQLGQRKYTLNVMVEEVDDEMLGQWRWISVELPIGQYDYGTIVSALVRAKYSQDEMEAALFNQSPEELEDINQWRTLCKKVAHEVLEEIPE
ncbi:MAG: hypothetical protein IJK45_01420 [Bacteroidaceae bacterium]|nr:hypothetical protein [Bacteroidaceae bacterium]